MFFPYHDDNPTTRPPIITLSVILLNAIVFLSMQRLDEEQKYYYAIEHGFIPARIGQLRDHNLRIPIEVPPERLVNDKRPGQVIVVPQMVVLEPRPGEIYMSLLTTMFLHGSWMHLLGNMWFMWLFGNNIEDRLGHLPFLVFYLVGGLAATACHWALNQTSTIPVIGASGAIAAVLGAYIVTYPHARVHTFVVLIIFFTTIDLPAIAVLGLWFGMQLLEAVGRINLDVNGGVAWWAHIGGFAAGALLMPLVAMLIRPPRPPQEEEPRAVLRY